MKKINVRLTAEEVQLIVANHYNNNGFTTPDGITLNCNLRGSDVTPQLGSNDWFGDTVFDGVSFVLYYR